MGEAFVAVALPLAVAGHWLAYASGDHWSMDVPASSELLTHAYLIPFALLFATFVHEFGHLAAALSQGARTGLIIVKPRGSLPAFVTQIPELWQLSRHQRVIVDFGGCWLQLLITGILGMVYWITGAKDCALAIRLTDLLIVLALVPTPGSDGYWLLSDFQGFTNMRKELWLRLHARSSSSWILIARVSILLAAAILILYVAMALTFAAWSLRLIVKASSYPVVSQLFSIKGASMLCLGTIASIFVYLAAARVILAVRIARDGTHRWACDS
jgi:hypothetical protein